MLTARSVTGGSTLSTLHAASTYQIMLCLLLMHAAADAVIASAIEAFGSICILRQALSLRVTQHKISSAGPIICRWYGPGKFVEASTAGSWGCLQQGR